VRFHGERQSVPVPVRPEGDPNVLEQCGSGIVAEGGDGAGHASGHQKFHERVRRRKVRRPHRDIDDQVPEAGAGEKGQEHGSLRKRERLTNRPGGGRADVRSARVGHGEVTRAGAEHAQRQPAPRHQHPAHLVKRRRPVGEELEPLLAEHDVERSTRQRHRDRAALPPLDGGVRRPGPRRGQHARAEVEADHGPARPHAPRCLARDDAGPARDVEHTLTGLETGAEDEVDRPRLEDRGDHVTLEQLGGGFAEASPLEPRSLFHC
jgi:hypothetical protein